MGTSIYKKISLALLGVLFLNISLCLAQNGVPPQDFHASLELKNISFPEYSLFHNAGNGNRNIRNVVREAQMLSINSIELEAFITTPKSTWTLALPYHGQVIKIALHAMDNVPEDFKVYENDLRQSVRDVKTTLTYQGVIQDDKTSMAAISIGGNGELMGLIHSEKYGTQVLGKMADSEEYILYESTKMEVTSNFSCQSSDPSSIQTGGAASIQSVAEVNGCVTLYWEGDYELFQNKGSIQSTVDYMIGTFNQMNILFNTESISTYMNQILVWTIQDNYSTTNPLAALDDFIARRPTFDASLGHLISLGGSSLSGIAYPDRLCNSNNAAYSRITAAYQNVPTYSWTIEVVTHETGHNLGSPHTHACLWNGNNTPIDGCGPAAGYNEGCTGPIPSSGGTIMSYCHLGSSNPGINLSLGFGTQPGNLIRTEVSNAACLASACPTANTCLAPPNLTISNVTGTAATVSWGAASGATSYTLRYRLSGTTAWTTLTGVSSPTGITGLTNDQTFEVAVRSHCGSNTSFYAGALFFTNSNAGCPTPNALTTTSLSSTAATLSWAENGTATSWDIFRTTSSSTVPTSSTTPSFANVGRPYVLTGLITNTRYYVFVRSICGSGRSGWSPVLIIDVPSANDTPSGATLIQVNQVCSGNIFTNLGATYTSGEPNPGVAGNWFTNANQTVWFKFVAPPSGTVQVSTDFSPNGTNNDTQIALYSAQNVSNYSTYAIIASDEDGGIFGSGYTSLINYSGLTSGTTYYIQIDGYDNVEGTFCLEVMEKVALNTVGNCASNFSNLVSGNTYTNFYDGNLFNGILGNVIAAINPLGQNLGTVTIQMDIPLGTPVSSNGISYMKRYVNISSTIAPTSPVKVRLFFRDADFATLKTMTGNTNATIANLNITHYDGINEDCLESNNNYNTGTVQLITNATADEVNTSDVFYLDFSVSSFSEMGVHFGAIALPVELTSFTGKAENTYNHLQWETASERNSYQFVVERRSEQNENWTTLGYVDATNQVDGAKYHWTDQKPLDVGYYRLAMVDFDGTVENSSIVRIVRATSTWNVIGLSPNPVSDLLTIRMDNKAPWDGTVEVMDITGRILYQQQVQLEKGDVQWTIDTANWPSGWLLVRCQHPDQSMNILRCVKQ